MRKTSSPTPCVSHFVIWNGNLINNIFSQGCVEKERECDTNERGNNHTYYIYIVAGPCLMPPNISFFIHPDKQYYCKIKKCPLVDRAECTLGNWIFVNTSYTTKHATISHTTFIMRLYIQLIQEISIWKKLNLHETLWQIPILLFF